MSEMKYKKKQRRVHNEKIAKHQTLTHSGGRWGGSQPRVLN